MQSKALTPEAVLQLKELYAQLDEHGRRRWSHMRLAKQFGIGETTVYRALNGYGTFVGAPQPVPDSLELQQRMRDSAAKLLAELAKPAAAAIPLQEPSNEPKPEAAIDPISGKPVKRYY